ncbi:hypothetical protein BSKO_09013 [Bryopsis sp. KO-2023]|nr:hypothetical protein BSKO_09013 [Bryopsis sp. KO-2023]
MPLVLDENALSWETFDVQTASTLYWQSVPVLLKHLDREEQVEELTVRILSGFTRQNHNLRILRVHVSSEEDLFFLHSLEVSEEEFQGLKADQGILVDFSNFPNKIITLLAKCIESRGEENPRFQAELVVSGCESLFRIVETNDFNKLPHITLKFRSGSDTAIKQFLAFRLTEVRSNCKELTEELRTCEDARDSTSSQFASCREKLASVQAEHERCMLEMKGNQHTQLAQAQEEKAREKSELKESLDREWGEVERRLRERLEVMTKKSEELDQENRKLRSQKCDLETKYSETNHRLASAEGYRTSLGEECSRLKELNKKLSEDKHTLEIKLNEMKGEGRANTEKIRANGEVLDQQRSRIRDMEASNRQLESRCEELIKAVQTNEDSSLQVSKQNQRTAQIAGKLTQDMKNIKEKNSHLKKSLARQDEKMIQQKRAADKAEEKRKAIEAVLESFKKENDGLRLETEDLRSKLEDGKTQLQESEGMIRWLNKQINDAQLQSSTRVPGSRYTFQPSASVSLPPAPNLRKSEPSGGRPALANPSLSARLSRIRGSSENLLTLGKEDFGGGGGAEGLDSEGAAGVSHAVSASREATLALG